MITATRYHDISCGHRVAGHESKCAELHGHNYRIHFTCRAAKLDAVGRVMDFSAIKGTLCMWLEHHWDHRFLAWNEDKLMWELQRVVQSAVSPVPLELMFARSVVWLPFNPTAENMARYLLEVVGPVELSGTGVQLIEVRVDETRKCSATATREDV